MNSITGLKYFALLLLVFGILPGFTILQSYGQSQQIRPTASSSLRSFAIYPADQLSDTETNSGRLEFQHVYGWFRENLNNTRWGAETNSFSVGLLPQYSTYASRTEIALFPVMKNSLANASEDGLSWTFWLLPKEHQYQMTLRDDTGKIVTSSPMCANHCQPFTIDVNKIDANHGYQRCLLRGAPPLIVFPTPILLRDYFQITNAGTYHLEFRLLAVRKMFAERKIQEYSLPANLDIVVKQP